jgi:hypothetical protein
MMIWIIFPIYDRIGHAALRQRLYRFLVHAITLWPHNPSFHWVCVSFLYEIRLGDSS